MTTGYGPVPFQGQDPTSEMSRAAQEELYALLLNHMQGAFGTESSVEMTAPNGEDTPADLEAGMIVRLDPTTLTFLIGLDGTSLGYFAKPAGGYSGVPGDGNVYGDGILALPSCACYRLCTNNFASGQAGSLVANTPITSNAAGRITSGTFYNDTIVGIVARGMLDDYDKPGRDVVEFFTYFLPSLDTWSVAYVEPMNDDEDNGSSSSVAG